MGQKKMKKILVTGALGQIGTELTSELRRLYGDDNVVATSRRAQPPEGYDWYYEQLDVTDAEALDRGLRRHRPDTIFHLAAMLSAVSEQEPQHAWKTNIEGLRNVLETASAHGIPRIFWPSSIAVFSPESPRVNTPQETVMRPTTMYGITKLAGELLCDYYFQRYGLDVRGLRYPGIISSQALPGGGTTDYAVEIFHEALKVGRYTCFVREDTVLPMMYMPDCIEAALNLMEADGSRLRHHNSFNVTAMSFSAGELAAEIRKYVPELECEYVPDQRQAIADSWPESIDDSAARVEWGWEPAYDLAAMTEDMIAKLRAQ